MLMLKYSGVSYSQIFHFFIFQFYSCVFHFLCAYQSRKRKRGVNEMLFSLFSAYNFILIIAKCEQPIPVNSLYFSNYIYNHQQIISMTCSLNKSVYVLLLCFQRCKHVKPNYQTSDFWQLIDVDIMFVQTLMKTVNAVT